MLVILKGTLCLFMAVLPCSAQLHSDRRLDATTICQDGTCFESTAHAMFDVIAKFATGDPSATYELTTTTTFEDLFTCTIGDPKDDLAESQHFAWQGFVDYAEADANTIFLKNENGDTVEVVDQWGDRCESSPGCSVTSPRYQECADSQTCEPKVLEYPLDDGTTLYIDIYERTL